MLEKLQQNPNKTIATLHYKETSIPMHSIYTTTKVEESKWPRTKREATLEHSKHQNGTTKTM